MKKITGLTLAAVLLAVGLTLAAGCGPAIRVDGVKENIVPDKVFDLKTRQSLSPDELKNRLAQTQVVILGEIHNHPEQHRRQLDILQTLFAGYPQMVLGLEVFNKDQQNLLDRWLKGDVADVEFQTEVMNDILSPDTYMVYQPILFWARDNHVPVLGLNAPQPLVAKVAREGLEKLSREERMSLPFDIELGPEEYRRRVVKALPNHPGKMDPLNFFSAQVVRDETMAETMAGYMAGKDGRQKRAVVICGNEHVLFGHGVPKRLAKRFPGSMTTVVMPLTSEPEELNGQAADFAWVAEPSKRRRLGVAFDKNVADALVVASVSPGSEAERIGLKPGDKLLLLDGRELYDMLAMHRAAAEGGPDQDHVLVFQRGGEKMERKFRFKE